MTRAEEAPPSQAELAHPSWRPMCATTELAACHRAAGPCAVSGVANTAVGALAIYTQMRLHISPALANLLGHATGLLFSCFNARNDVFRF